MILFGILPNEMVMKLKTLPNNNLDALYYPIYVKGKKMIQKFPQSQMMKTFKL